MKLLTITMLIALIVCIALIVIPKSHKFLGWLGEKFFLVSIFLSYYISRLGLIIVLLAGIAYLILNYHF